MWASVTKLIKMLDFEALLKYQRHTHLVALVTNQKTLKHYISIKRQVRDVMQSIHSTVNVATLETNIGLHDSWILGTFHMLWDLSSSNADIYPTRKTR